jgi:hypothetical protein
MIKKLTIKSFTICNIHFQVYLITEDHTGGACSTREIDDKFMQNFSLNS